MCKAHLDLVNANQCTFFLDHLPQVLAFLKFRGSKDVSPAIDVGCTWPGANQTLSGRAATECQLNLFCKVVARDLFSGQNDFHVL